LVYALARNYSLGICFAIQQALDRQRVSLMPSALWLRNVGPDSGVLLLWSQAAQSMAVTGLEMSQILIALKALQQSVTIKRSAMHSARNCSWSTFQAILGLSLEGSPS
jgi:hypothetical protein